MIRPRALSVLRFAVLGALACSWPTHATDISTEPLNTYSAPSSTDVKPNVLFILDDSGSMDWNYMPDWADGPFALTVNSASSASVTSIKVNGWEILNAVTGASNSTSTVASRIVAGINACTYSLPSTTNCQITGYSAILDGSDISVIAPGGTTIVPVVTYSGTLNITRRSTTPAYLFRNSAYNGVAYNPAVRYDPPTFYDSTGTLNTTTYPSQTSAATSGWTAVKNDGYRVQDLGTTNLVNAASYYTIIAGEYCSTPSLRNCVSATAPSTAYPYAAKLRWCNSSSVCRATWDGTYSYWRAPTPRSATITISGSANTSVSSVKVNGVEILSAATVTSTSPSTLAASIAAQINACTNSISGACGTAGYSASSTDSSGGLTNVVTIYAPDANSSTPVITTNPIATTMSFAATAFAVGSVPGENLRTTITSGITSYTYPGSATKAATRTDCTGSTCTYTEEMTNYANWWAYYRTRMQMMKTAVSSSFSKIDNATDVANGVSRFRLGYLTLNNNTSADFLNLGEFAGSQKGSWYAKLMAANPGSGTPLRATLSTAGRLFAGKLNGASLNGSTVVDPLQYSCQQNYTILSTDGFWNGGGGVKMNGSTSIGNEDGALPRPYTDGGGQLQTRTSTLQSQTVTAQAQASTSTLQQRTAQLQTRTSVLQQGTPRLQRRTSSNSGGSWSSWSDVTSCTWDNSGSSRTQCQYVSPASWSTVSSCNDTRGTSTSSGSTWSSATQCQYGGWTAWAGTPSCSVTAQSSGPNYTVGTARDCQTVGLTAFTNVSSCTATTPDASGTSTQCQYTAWTSYTNVASCTPVAQSASSPYTVGTATQCQTQTTLGPWTTATSCTSSSSMNCAYTAWTGWANASSCTAVPQSTGPSYTVPTARECQTVTSGGTSNTLADVASYYYNTDLRSSDATKGTGTCTGPTIAPSTTPNDLCADNVPTNGRDVATTQHMTTFTLGLGAQGQMVYAPTDGKDYWNDTSGDFFDVRSGTTATPASGICSWQSSGACNWPVPASDSINNIDDLWHAAVNGHGAYFSATDPLSLANGLTQTLATIVNTPRPGTAAAAASSNPNVSASDNYVFSSSYKSVEWYGELIRQQITTSGTLTGQNWSAMKLLDCATTPWSASTGYVVGNVYRQGTRCYEVIADYTSGAAFDSSSSGVDIVNTRVVNVDETASPKVPVTAPTSRTIYTKGSSGLIPFTWSDLDATMKSYFTKPAIAYVSGTTGLTQFCSTGGTCLSATAQDNNTLATNGAAGEALVNFLRGDRTFENTYYRKRMHVLGDIVSAEARYVQAPMFSYTDPGYSDFKTSKTSRAGAVYVGANDGMVHAFDAASGKELWAYIPGMVLPNIYKLADKNYSTQHQYFVDGTPEVGDVCPTAPGTACSGSGWKTILVGGLNRGGKGYYALDITDPNSPVLLWEFTDANLGYSYGNPKIVKLKDGTWVVLLSTGYNNADGVGRLYVLNAYTGSVIRTISTGVGTPANPSGLAKISAHVLQPATDNTVIAAYGGDVLGNLWRFDVNGDIGASGFEAHRLISFTDSGGQPQPVTVRPVEATVNGNPIVYVGTGKYLGTTDVANTQVESFYAVKDKLDTTTYGDPRVAANGFVQQTLSAGTCPANTPESVCTSGQTVRTNATINPVDWTVKNGWFFDFLTGGERSSSDPSLALGTLLFTTITPASSSASACGDGTNTSASFVYAINYLTGGAVDGSNGVSGMSLGSGLVTRPVMIEQADGTVRALIRTSGGAVGGDGTDLGGTLVITPPIKPSSSSGTKRVSWRELNTK